MTVRAVVRSWSEDEGWGVLDCPETPGGCWTHFSVVTIDGYRSLKPGQPMQLEYERADQDGYAYRAVRSWPVEAEPAAEPEPLPTRRLAAPSPFGGTSRLPDQGRDR